MVVVMLLLLLLLPFLRLGGRSSLMATARSVQRWRVDSAMLARSVLIPSLLRLARTAAPPVVVLVLLLLLVVVVEMVPGGPPCFMVILPLHVPPFVLAAVQLTATSHPANDRE